MRRVLSSDSTQFCRCPQRGDTTHLGWGISALTGAISHACRLDLPHRRVDNQSWIAGWPLVTARMTFPASAGSEGDLPGLNVVTERLADGLGHADPIGGRPQQQIPLQLRIETN